MISGMPSVALLFYHPAKPGLQVLTEKKSFRNGIPVVITYKIKCLQHNGKVIETETLTFYCVCWGEGALLSIIAILVS